MKIEIEIAEKMIEKVLTEDGKELVKNINTELKYVARDKYIKTISLSSLCEMFQHLEAVNRTLAYYGFDTVKLVSFNPETESYDDAMRRFTLDGDNYSYDRDSGYDVDGRSDEEKRVCDYLQKIIPDIGCGTDPIGFLIASHSALLHDKKKLQNEVEDLKEQYRDLHEEYRNEVSDLKSEINSLNAELENIHKEQWRR